MARKVRTVQDASSDDDVPEVVSHSISKADAKRNQKALRDFEADEKARRKARNRERDQKLKERARVTRGAKAEEKQAVRFLEDEDEDDVETRMLRAMRDAADEIESLVSDKDDDDEFGGFGERMGSSSGSESSFVQDEDGEDADISPSEDNPLDAEDVTDGEMGEVEEDDELLSAPRRSRTKAGYLPDDVFAAAFASQNSKPDALQKNTKPTQQQTVKKRRRKSNVRPKDLVMSDRTIRTLPQLSDPRSQATARSVPSARARRFMDHSLAMKGKQALLRTKKKGWERRPANVGVMKYQGAPHGFARSTR